MANTMSFEQVVTVFNSLMAQALGGASVQVTDTASFVSVAQTALLSGMDPLALGISQVLDKAIFSARPDYARFRAMEKSNAEYGSWTRKINYCDRGFIQDDGYPLTDGTTVDPFIIRHPEVIQLNFYGQNVLADLITRSNDQMKAAFRGPDEFGEFFTGALQNLSNEHEQRTEAIARGNLINAIAAIEDSGSTDQHVHLLTEYNAILTAAGKTALTSTTVYDPDNYADFMKWAYARIQQVRDMLTERSIVFHMNVTSPSAKYISRHTPYNRQILYMYAPELRQMEARVLSAAFNEGRLAYRDIELVNYWQGIDTPDTVIAQPVYMGTDGAAYSPETVPGTIDTVTVNNVFALLVDDDAMGYTRYSDGMNPIYNPRGDYWNVFYRWRWQNWIDFTENQVLFTLD